MRRTVWGRLDVAVLVVVAAASIGLAWLGTVASWWPSVPVSVRFASCLIVFGISPGLLVAGTLVIRRQPDISIADFVHAVFTSSFSCNLLFNITLFLTQTSFATMARRYVVLQAVGYGVWATWWLFSRSSDRSPTLPRATSNRLAFWSVLTLAGLVCLLVGVTYHNGSLPVNPEELVSLRKLAENPAVRYDNITFRDHEPSTYFFVPFQVFLVGTSTLARLDVALTYSMFWCVTTLLSLVVLTRFSYVLFGRGEVAALICLLMVLIGVFDPRGVIYDAGVVSPYPNRYGFGSGVLLPLGLLWLWSILREDAAHVWRWALLIYLIVETTFVHARETLLSMGVMLALLILLLSSPRRHVSSTLRLGAAIGVMVIVLIAYKAFNLSMSPGLDAYVSSLTERSLGAMHHMLDDVGVRAWINEPPSSVTVSAGTASSVDIDIVGFTRLFVRPWASGEHPGRLFMPVAMLALPFYALRATSLVQLTLALVLAGLGLITASGPIGLYLAAMIGNPEVFQAHAILFIVEFYVLGDVAFTIGRWAEEATRGRPVARAAILAGTALVAAAFFQFAVDVIEWRSAIASMWSPIFTWSFIGLTLAAVAFRLWVSELPLFPVVTGTGVRLMASTVAALLVVTTMMPAIRLSEVWERGLFRSSRPPGRFSGELLVDYGGLVASNRLERSYPISVVRHFRTAVEPGRLILSRDTLPLMMSTPHFAAIVSLNGRVRPSYIANAHYLERYARDSRQEFAVLPYLTDEEGRTVFRRMLSDLAVEFLVVDESESEAVRPAIAQDPQLSSLLMPVLEQDGFIVYEVR